MESLASGIFKPAFDNTHKERCDVNVCECVCFIISVPVCCSFIFNLYLTRQVIKNTFSFKTAPWQKANPREGRRLKINVKRWQRAAHIKTSPAHPPLTYNHNKHDIDSIQSSTQPHKVSQQTAASGDATEEQTGRQGKTGSSKIARSGMRPIGSGRHTKE